jgi:hypothetical protein
MIKNKWLYLYFGKYEVRFYLPQLTWFGISWKVSDGVMDVNVSFDGIRKQWLPF